MTLTLRELKHTVGELPLHLLYRLSGDFDDALAPSQLSSLACLQNEIAICLEFCLNKFWQQIDYEHTV